MGRSQGLGVETQSHWLGHTGLRSRQTGCPGQLAPQESMHFWKKKKGFYYNLYLVILNTKKRGTLGVPEEAWRQGSRMALALNMNYFGWHSLSAASLHVFVL